MKVLMITGDKKFGPGHERYELQRSIVDALSVVYWGRGSLWPKIPAGQFDVVTVQDPFWRGFFAWRVAKRLSASFNVQVHTDLSVYGSVRRALARFVLRRADSVRVVSQKIKSQVEQMGVYAKIAVLPVFVNVEEFKNIKLTEDPRKIVLWLGRFEGEKDPIGGITVFTEVLSLVPDAKLLMLGKGSYEQSLRTKSQGKPNIEFPGWQDPKPFFAIAKVVLCTSKHESFGSSIVEALAAGVPVVAPDVGVAKEAGAIVVPRGQLASAVVQVLQEGPKGELLLTMPTKEEWAQQWKKTL